LTGHVATPPATTALKFSFGAGARVKVLIRVQLSRKKPRARQMVYTLSEYPASPTWCIGSPGCKQSPTGHVITAGSGHTRHGLATWIRSKFGA